MEPQIAIDAFSPEIISQHEDPPNASFDEAEVRWHSDSGRMRKQPSRIETFEIPPNEIDQGPRPRPSRN